MSQERKEFIKQLEDWSFEYSTSSKFLVKKLGDLDISFEFRTGNIIVYETYVGVLCRVLDPTPQDVIQLAKEHLNITLELPQPANHGSIKVGKGYKVVKPTHKEFGNAGFSYDNETHYYTKKVSDYLSIVTNDSECILKHGDQPIKTVKATKENINEMYKYFKGKDIEWSPKKYTWETCFSGQGWFVDYISGIESVDNGISHKSNLNVVPTESHAKTLLALSELMTIVHRINADYPRTRESDCFYYLWLNNNNTFGICNQTYGFVGCGHPLTLNTQEGAEILIRDNKELLLEYFNNI